MPSAESSAITEQDFHSPDRIKRYVDSLIPELDQSAPVSQFLGVLACQNSQLVDRFLTDLHSASDKASVKPEYVFVMDDSWDDEAASSIEAVAREHGADYHRVREKGGLGDEVIDAFHDGLPGGDSSVGKAYKKWLAYGSLRNYLDVPLEASETGNGEMRGGCGGARNLGYLTAIHEAGRRGVALEDCLITINDDDHRYYALEQQGDNVYASHHDFFAERAAWLKDPETEVLLSRYAGHRGNPISLILDSVRECQDIVSRKIEGDETKSYTLFDETADEFNTVSVHEAFRRMPEIIASIIERRPIIGMVTSERYRDEPSLGWEKAKIHLGTISLRGTMAARAPIPAAALYDLNYGTLLRSEAVKNGNPDRVIREDKELMHQRAPRPDGGNAGGNTLFEVFTNKRAEDQVKMVSVIRSDEDIQREISEAIGIEYDQIQNLVIDMQLNTRRAAEIMDHMKSLDVYRDAILDFEEGESVAQSLDALRQSLPEEALKTVMQPLSLSFTEREAAKFKNSIRRYLRIHKLWPQLASAAYAMGQR